MRANFGVEVAKELDKLGYEVIERLVVLVALENVVRVFADLLQGAESALAHRVVVRVEALAQFGQQLGPRVQPALGHDGGDEDADGGADELTLVADALHALLFDELLARLRELVEKSLGVVLQDEAAE